MRLYRRSDDILRFARSPNSHEAQSDEESKEKNDEQKELANTSLLFLLFIYLLK